MTKIIIDNIKNNLDNGRANMVIYVDSKTLPFEFPAHSSYDIPIVVLRHFTGYALNTEKSFSAKIIEEIGENTLIETWDMKNKIQRFLINKTDDFHISLEYNMQQLPLLKINLKTINQEK